MISLRRSTKKLREGTAAQFVTANPILWKGEESLETDTLIRKVGDGVTAYASLPTLNSYTWQPKDNNFKGANFPPRLMTYAYPVPAGFHFLQKMWVPAGSVITNTHLYVSGAGATVVGYYMAVYEADGTRSGMSAAQTTLMESVGLKTFPMAAPIAAQSVGRWVYLAFVYTSAGTIPSIGSPSVMITANLGTVSPDKTCGYIGAAAPPAANADFSLISDYFEFWVAVS